ncbi:pilus assembly protein [Methanobrevibacter sp.]|uniref:pilus assembly protein n=1 Tax=Methanobrevibacter sp. TaxID=66852 RepID=UPI0026E036C5|nr:pilus assembly protein [Methanobrevibacter sp.]
MEIYMQKIGLIRPDSNPKNSSLDLGIDWSIDYIHNSRNELNFNIILKSTETFNLSFKIEGIVYLDASEVFVQEDVSQIIFSRACNVLMNMVSLTAQSSHILSNEEKCPSLDSEHVPDTLYN